MIRMILMIGCFVSFELELTVHVRRSPYLVVVEGDVAPVDLLLVVVDLLHLEHVPDKHHRPPQHSAIFFYLTTSHRQPQPMRRLPTVWLKLTT